MPELWRKESDSASGSSLLELPTLIMTLGRYLLVYMKTYLAKNENISIQRRAFRVEDGILQMDCSLFSGGMATDERVAGHIHFGADF